DVAILGVTFVLTIFADLVVAVSIGVIMAFMQLLRRMTESFEVQTLGNEDLKAELQAFGMPALPRDCLVYEIDGPFFFAAVESFETAIKSTGGNPRILVLRLRRVPFIDSTGLQSLLQVVQDMHRRGVQIWLCEANHRVKAKLLKFGVLDKLAAQDYADKFSDHLRRLTDADARP
ncbi:MAG: STAS domain-containing protein, partial [Lacisediminimonas sp.]|nr:STAS domain-containing protein [Lacisediminimonas sp.]